jgi:hypothetical protein
MIRPIKEIAIQLKLLIIYYPTVRFQFMKVMDRFNHFKIAKFLNMTEF